MTKYYIYVGQLVSAPATVCRMTLSDSVDILASPIHCFLKNRKIKQRTRNISVTHIIIVPIKTQVNVSHGNQPYT